MKIKNGIIAAVLGLSAVTFFSCENFLNSMDIRQALEDEVKYAKSESFTIRFSADEKGTLKTGEGDRTCKVTDSFVLEFSPNAAYQFVSWKAVSRDDGSDLSSHVSFMDARNPITEVKIEKQGNIEIIPLCAERPYVSEFSPAVSATVPSVAKNFPISITFSKPLVLTDEDLARIEIAISDDDVKEHFKAPVISGSTVTFEADNDRLIDFTSGTKTVRVTIPGDFYYIANSTENYEGDRIYIGSDVKKTYVINTTTEERTTINFIAEAGSGEIKPSGSQLYNYGDQVALEFEESGTHKFLRWETSDSEKVIIESPKAPVTTAAIRSTEKNAVINVNAVCAERPYVSDFSPAVSAAVPTVAKNFPIIITFSRTMNLTAKDLDRIEISSLGENLKDYYEGPVFGADKKTVTFNAKRSNLIPVDSTRTINVTVPADFNYLSDDGTKITLEKTVACSFKINSKTIEKATIKVEADAEFGKLEGTSGENAYSLDEKIYSKFTPKEAYNITGWSFKDQSGNEIPEEKIKEFLDYEISDSKMEFSAKVKSGLEEDDRVTISPVCVERGKLNVSFIATHGSTIPSEDKSYYKGNTFNLRYSEDGDYAFTGWKVVDAATNLEVDDVLRFDNDGKDVVVEVLKTDASVKIIAENGERPVVMDFAPGFKGEGVFIDSVLKYIFSQPMSLSSIYWTESELAEMGITSETHELLEAVYENVAQKDEDGNPYYYAYKEKDDVAGISLKFKNYEIYRRGTTENLLMHYGCPGFDVTRSVLTVPVNRDNMPPKITEIEFKVHKAMTNENGIAMASAFKKFYFTNATSDNLPPEFSSLKVVQIDENGESELSQEANDVKFNIPENLKNLNRAKKNFKINVKGSVSDTGSKPAKLTAALKPQYSDYYDEGRRVDANEVMLALAGPVSDFTQEGYTFDFTDKITVDGVYDLVIIASDNSGNKKEEPFRIIYDHTAPVDSDFEYDSTIAQDWVKYKFKNRAKDIKKTVIKGFTDESSREIVRNDLKENKLQEFKGLKCTKASRWHTIEITECDYLGNERTHTERIYAVPAVGMYYSKYADEKDITKDKEYWTSIKDDAKVISGIILGHLASEDDFSKMRAFVSTRIAQYGTSPVYDYWSRVDEGVNRPSGYKDKMKNEKDGLMLLKYIEENFPAMKKDTKDVEYKGNTTTTKSLWNNCWTEGNQPSSSLPPPPGMSRFVYLDNTYIPTITELNELFTIEIINKIDNYYLRSWYNNSATSQYWLFSSSLFIVDGYQELVNVYEPKSNKERVAPKHPNRNSSDNPKVTGEGALIKFGESGKHLCEVYFTQINMEE